MIFEAHTKNLYEQRYHNHKSTLKYNPIRIDSKWQPPSKGWLKFNSDVNTVFTRLPCVGCKERCPY